jgi:hypothetical protein
MPSKRRSGKERVSKQAAGPWLIHFFRRHSHDEPSESVPARDFFESCPAKVSAMMIAVTRAVAEAPPPTFSGGGKWEAAFLPLGEGRCRTWPRRPEPRPGYRHGQAIPDQALGPGLRRGPQTRARVPKTDSPKRLEVTSDVSDRSSAAARRMGRAELEAKPDRSSQADDRSQGRVALLRCQEPPDRFWRSTSTAGQVGLAQANAFAGIVDLAHESIDRVDLGPGLPVRGSEVRIFHPALNVPVESGLGARHTRNIYDT